MHLTNLAILLTGSKRIGADVARSLAEAGADVAIAFNRSRAEADETVGAIRSLGRHATAIQADLNDAAQCKALVDNAAAALGRLDVLVNMASIYEAKPADEMTPADFDRMLAVDLRASFLCAHAAIPHMRRQRGGRIVNFGDWLPRSGRPRYIGYLGYYVAKAGVAALTEALALELAKDRILVNAVAPGPIIAPPGTSAEELHAVEQATPLGHWGGSGEIAKCVRFLIETDFVTGEVVRVDGGRHVK